MKPCAADPEKCTERKEWGTGCYLCLHEYQLYQRKCYTPVEIPAPYRGCLPKPVEGR
jgi:hypothetical protein